VGDLGAAGWQRPFNKTHIIALGNFVAMEVEQHRRIEA